MGLSCRPASTEADAKAVFLLLLEMGKEICRFVPDYDKGFAEIYRLIKDEAVYIVFDDAGLAVASVGLTLIDGMWWSQDKFFSEQWFYVLEPLRADGHARKMLEAEVAALCDLTGHPAFIKYFDPQKMRDNGRRVFVGEENGYIPTGRIARVNPSVIPNVEG